MSTGNQRRTRSDLVAGLRLPPGQAERLLGQFKRGDVLLRIALALIAALLMWAATGAWAPHFGFRSGESPRRAIVTRTAFEVVDKEETENRRRQARSQTLAVYQNDSRRIVELRKALKDSIFQVTSADQFEALSVRDKQVWSTFLVSSGNAEDNSQVNQEQLFNDLNEALAEDAELKRFERAVQAALSPSERNGLLVNLQHDLDEGSQSAILVHDIGQDNYRQRVEVKDVRIAEITAGLRQRLAREFEAAELPGKHLETLAQLTFNWLTNKKLPTTLNLNGDATRAAQNEAMDKVEVATRTYLPGESLVDAGEPLRKEDIDLLLKEYRAELSQMTWGERIRRSAADIGMFIALYVLCGSYVFFHHPKILWDLNRFGTLLGLVVATIATSMIASADQWRAESIPLILFGTTIAVAYERELALLLAAAVALVISISCGQGLPEFVILVASGSSAILLVDRIRSRTKLLFVGLGAGIVAMLTTMGVGTLVNQSYGWSGLSSPTLGTWDEFIRDSFALRLFAGALWYGFCAVLSGLLLTGLLPFIERLFDVQTDISLLELGDAAHPLLQELVQRAPGTYNHSITVASIAEAAAEAIGANGLLVRVGAYFHDIGKMLKPIYFIENQGGDGNRHDSLMPAMSTLVIIAHVKDGADLARQHHLPRSIIDFIEQHHGTTLVEYFYREATKRSEQDPDSSDVDETSFRYPGPKPQTRESGVLMLADAAESICRTLVDPAPSRIENVVKELVMKRLMDGQFDECNLTLKELHIIEDALVKSLTAVYHGRVKYPSQQTA